MNVACEEDLTETHVGEPSWQPVIVLDTKTRAEMGWVAGYGMLLERYRLRVPLPPRLAAVSSDCAAKEDSSASTIAHRRAEPRSHRCTRRGSPDSRRRWSASSGYSPRATGEPR